MPLLLLLDWSNAVFARMDTVIDAFMASDAAEKAQLLQQHHSELGTLADADAKQQRQHLEANLRKLLGTHAKCFTSSIYQELRSPKDLVLALINGADQQHRDTCSTAAAAELAAVLLQQAVQLVVVADAGKRDRWKTQQGVLARAQELGQEYGVTADEVADELQAIAAAAERQDAQQEEDQAAQQLSNVDEAQQGAAEQQLDSELQYRLKGALLFIARCTLEKALAPGKAFLVPGCIADEAIAALVHANAALQQPHPMCIKSDDSDFWQLRSYNSSSSRICSSGGVSNGGSGNTITSSSSSSGDGDKGPAAEASGCPDTDAAGSQDNSGSSSNSGSYRQWPFHCGIQWDFQLSGANIPSHHLKRCAILGKGREELTHYGTVFGPVPAGLQVADAAGTEVVGQQRPGDALYREQFAAFDAAARSEEPWKMEVPAILEWLQQYRHQVGVKCPQEALMQLHMRVPLSVITFGPVHHFAGCCATVVHDKCRLLRYE